LVDHAGAERRVGVEIEFMGITARDAALALAAGLGGTAIEEDPHAFAVRDTALGDLRVELDIRYAHPRPHDATVPVRLGPRAAALLGWTLRGVVPRELITGPLAVSTLAEVDRAIGILHDAGAGGRGSTLFGSLGLHFNVDPPSLEAATLRDLLGAFVLLEPWLRRATVGSDGRRRPFLPTPFPADYARRIVASDHRPDIASLVADYLAANPTRDRGLDLLPILLHLDPARVRARLPFEKIGDRPGLHYRLPTAPVGRPGWSIAEIGRG
jgi:hypothetical protein